MNIHWSFMTASILFFALSGALSASEKPKPTLKFSLPSVAKLNGRIVYSALTADHWQIWILDLPSGNATCVTESAIDKRNPTWSRDGTAVFYRTTNGILERLELASAKIERIAENLGFITDPKVSPRGDRVAFARFAADPPDNTDIYILSLKNQALRRITGDVTLEYAPAWSPDETQIAFVSGRGARNHLLKVSDTNGRNTKTLQPNQSDDMSPVWSPDGTWIYFASCRSGDYEIWRVKSDGTSPQQLTHSIGMDFGPTFSPDGSKIIFTSFRDDASRLWVMDPDGSNQQPITEPPLQAREPEWYCPEAPKTEKAGASQK